MNPQQTPDDAGAHDRRHFFRRTLRRALSPLSEFIEERLAMPGLRTVLRPPGALPEPEFIHTCRRCHKCIDVCPADAIRPLRSPHEQVDGTPFIDPNVAACVICTDIACTTVCPSGALQLLLHPSQIRMGLAEVRHLRCLRMRGQDCTICVDRCPIGQTALRISPEGIVEVLEDGCTGCGVCQLYCPTSPKAIVVRVG